ncbi:ABC transporter permease, partial [Methylobacterium radiotolerans]
RATLLAMADAAAVAALALLFGVLYLNTAAAALATVAFLSIMRLLVVFPESIQKVLLTNYLNLYTWYGQDPATRMGLGASLILLLIYTVGFAAMTVYAFDRRDV